MSIIGILRTIIETTRAWASRLRPDAAVAGLASFREAIPEVGESAQGAALGLESGVQRDHPCVAGALASGAGAGAALDAGGSGVGAGAGAAAFFGT